MDLGAYIQIGDLQKIADENEIKVPRIRGYRLMKNEKPVTEDELKEMINSSFCDEVERYLTTEKLYGFTCHSFFDEDEEKKFIVIGKDNCRIGVRWENIHGNKKRYLHTKYHIHSKTFRRQYKLWNELCGKPDILYIHAKQGSMNWSSTTWRNFQKESWFIAACDDVYDPCYCDIYAKIKGADIQ